MKKVSIISIMFFLMAINGCEKNAISTDSLSILKGELREIASCEFYSTSTTDPCNEQNVYDNWGQSLFIAFMKYKNEKKTAYNPEDFKTFLTKAVPTEFLKFETNGVNLKNIDVLVKEFLSLFIQKNIFESIPLSIKMENHISKTKYLNQQDKTYLLKLVSILRYSTYISFSENSKKGDGSFERCWVRKLQEMEDSGIFEQLACIYSWPVCFGAMLADCAIEELQK